MKISELTYFPCLRYELTSRGWSTSSKLYICPWIMAMENVVFTVWLLKLGRGWNQVYSWPLPRLNKLHTDTRSLTHFDHTMHSVIHSSYVINDVQILWSDKAYLSMSFISCISHGIHYSLTETSLFIFSFKTESAAEVREPPPPDVTQLCRDTFHKTAEYINGELVCVYYFVIMLSSQTYIYIYSITKY